MKILIFGASGFMGLPTAQALVRAGHHVIGQSRDINNKAMFEKEEIDPLILDPNTDMSWTDLVGTLDVIIDCLSGDNIKDTSIKRVKDVEIIAQKRSPTADRLTYIWTSGTWIQGNDPFEPRSDGAAITDAPDLTAWRPQTEMLLTKSTVLRGIVIRPSLIYGRSGSITSLFFRQAAQEKSITWPGSRGGRIATVHTDDLAECYRLAVEKAPLVQGLVIDCTNQGQESTDLIFHNLAILAGFPQDRIHLKAPSNAFEEALITSRPLRASVARSILGWQPVKPTLTDGLQQYYKAFLAHSGTSKF